VVSVVQVDVDAVVVVVRVLAVELRRLVATSNDWFVS
jgi:hypothetical protein